MVTVNELAEQDLTETRERMKNRENSNILSVLEQVVESVKPYLGACQGHYKSDDYLSTIGVSVEFPDHYQACAWAHKVGMLSDVEVDNPKSSLAAVCTLSFPLMSFVARGKGWGGE